MQPCEAEYPMDAASGVPWIPTYGERSPSSACRAGCRARAEPDRSRRPSPTAADTTTGSAASSRSRNFREASGRPTGRSRRRTSERSSRRRRTVGGSIRGGSRRPRRARRSRPSASGSRSRDGSARDCSSQTRSESRDPPRAASRCGLPAPSLRAASRRRARCVRRGPCGRPLCRGDRRTFGRVLARPRHRAARALPDGRISHDEWLWAHSRAHPARSA